MLSSLFDEKEREGKVFTWVVEMVKEIESSTEKLILVLNLNVFMKLFSEILSDSFHNSIRLELL